MSRAAANIRIAFIGALIWLGATTGAFASCSGQFAAGYFCGVQPGGSAGIPGPVLLSPSSFQPIASHTVLSNVTGGSAAPSANSPSAVLDVIGSTQGDILYRDASGWQVLAPGTLGQVLQSGGPAANPSWGSVVASVSSVGLSMPGIFSVSGSPVTTTGTLKATLKNPSANLVWAGPSTGAASAPTFRALVGADLPNPSSSTLGGVQSAAAQTSKWINSISTSGVPSLTQPAFSDISGQATTSQLPSLGNNNILANISGGSAPPIGNTMTSLLDILGSTQGQVLYRNGSAWVPLAPGTNGQVLTTGGAAANPSWTTVTGTGTVTNVATGTGLTGGAITTTGTISFAAIGSNTILANITGGSAVPIPNTMTSLLDIIGSTQGNILYRGASNWLVLAPGTNGQVLTQGASTPSWANSGTVSSVATGSGLTGGPITTTGTVSIANGGVTAAMLASTTGSGSTVALSAGPTFTGTLSSANHTITSSSANALAVGANGTTNPALAVDASTGSSATGIKVTSAAAGGGAFLTATSSGTNEDFTIDAKGTGIIKLSTTTGRRVQFGINSTCGISQFSANADTSWCFGPSINSTSVFYVFNGAANAGVFLSSGGNTWTSSSDERLKTIIKPIDGAIQKLGTLRTVDYRYKTDDKNTVRLGLIAQDVEKVYPECVNHSGPKLNGEPTLGLSYECLVPALIAGVKEMQAEIAHLRAAR